MTDNEVHIIPGQSTFLFITAHVCLSQRVKTVIFIPDKWRYWETHFYQLLFTVTNKFIWSENSKFSAVYGTD